MAKILTVDDAAFMRKVIKDTLSKAGYADIFEAEDGAQAVENPTLMWKYVERSNVELIKQMTDMITCQRALQSCASVTKMYDEVMAHAASDVGRMG